MYPIFPSGGRHGHCTHPCLDIHATPIPQASIPPWFAEIIRIAGHLRSHGLLDALSTRVHLARKRFGQYVVMDYLALQFGDAISGERTLQLFFAESFMALFERGTISHRSTLSRSLAAIDSSYLEALRAVFPPFVCMGMDESGNWRPVGSVGSVVLLGSRKQSMREARSSMGVPLGIALALGVSLRFAYSASEQPWATPTSVTSPLRPMIVDDHEV